MLSLSLKTNISADYIRDYTSSFKKKVLFSKKIPVLTPCPQVKTQLRPLSNQIKSLVRKQPLNKEMFTLAAYHIQFIYVIPNIPTIFGIRALLNTGNILKSCLYDLSTLTVSLFSALTSIIPFNNAWQSGGIKWGI